MINAKFSHALDFLCGVISKLKFTEIDPMIFRIYTLEFRLKSKGFD